MKKNCFLLALAFFLSVAGNNLFSQQEETVKSPNKHQMVYPDFSRTPQTNKNDQTKIPRNGNTEAINVYAVTRTTGITYTPVAGGTSVTSWRNGNSGTIAQDDNLSNNQPIGFSFVYNGVRTDSFRVSTNGFVTFNTTSGATGGGTGAYGYVDSAFMVQNGTLNALAGLYEDMYAPSLTSSIVYQTTGSVGSRVLTVEWVNMKSTFDTLNPSINYQIKIYEADGHVEYVYGSMTPAAVSYSYSCGINAATLSATPTAAQLLVQQAANTATFSNTPVANLSALPAANSMISFTAPAQTVPGSPTSLTFTNVTGTSLTLNWIDNSSNETEFPIYISTNGINFSYIGAAAAGATTIGIINLTPSTPYFFQIWAANETKYSAASANNNTTTLATIPLSGTYTINPSAPISATNFQKFRQIDTALMNNGVNGPVTINVSGGTYNNDTISLNTIAGTSATNTVKFVGPVSAESRVLINAVGATGTQAAIALFGTDYVTFENIDVQDGGTSATDHCEYAYYVSNLTTGDGANFNVIKNSNITMGGGGDVVNFAYGCIQLTPAGATVGNNNNKYQNLVINRSDRGIALSGLAPGTLPSDLNCEISGCKLGQTTFIGNNGTGQAIGLLIQNAENVMVHDNILYSVKSPLATNANAIFGMLVQNASGEIYNNQILEVFQGNTTSAGVRSIGIQSGALLNGLVYYNNFISNVTRGYTAAANNGINCLGVRSTNFAGGGGVTEYYFNTIYMSAPAPVTYTSTAFGSFAGGVFMLTYDNIFINNISTSNSVARSIAINDGNTQTAPMCSGLLLSNFNNLYASGTNGVIGCNGAATYRTTLADWQSNNLANPSFTNNACDTVSSSVSVNFVNTALGDLHLAGASLTDVSLIGDQITGITTDIDGNTRGVKSFKGADQPSGASALTLKINFQGCPSVSTINVLLRNTSSPYAVVDSVSGIGGASSPCVINFTNAVDGTPYYVVVKSVNAIETWSSGFATFSGGAASYDFTSALSQAYLSNQILKLGIPSIYQGDANQDGFVNTADVILTYNNSAAFITSPSTDFNCDETTDLSDVSLAYNNATNFVQKKRP